MNKDVIYIDVEDDITSIVGKIKASKEKIIALVPPKRVGVLQSAVNMRLLTRTAENAGKRVVLITNDHTLAGLAAVANIPVAKNLQSKPEIAEIPALKVDGDDDIIDGSELPVGDHAAISSDHTPTKEAAAVAAIAAREKSRPSTKAVAGAVAGKKTPKVPNFNLFRKKFVLIGLGILLLIGFLVWAIWFAPRATVIITAKTNTVSVGENVILKTDAKTEPDANIIKTLKQEQKSEKSVEFTATGKKKVGEKATGKARIKGDAVAILMTGMTVPAGTQIQSASGSIFVTTQSAVFPKADTDSYVNGVVVGVAAKEIGPEYNGATGSASTSAAGVSSVSFVDATSGGTSREVTVVSADDVAKATDKLNEQKDEGLKKKLEESFGSSAMIIQESYNEQAATPSPSVAVDQEAEGPVTLKSSTVATMLAIDRDEIKTFLKVKAEKEIGEKESQKIYNDGVSSTKFTQFNKGDDGDTVRLAANVEIGPAIDEEKVKEQAKGKSYGDIQASLEAIDGVDDVDTKFSPFWVRTVPNDTSRIDVKFDVKNVDS